MIAVRYTGGLGNQMFEYAMSVILAEKFPEEKIYADLSRYDLTKEHNGFELGKYFDINVKLLPDNLLKQVAPLHYLLKKLGLLFLLKKFPVPIVERINHFIEKRNFKIGIVEDLSSTNYNENIFELNKDSVILWHYKGNWINPLYWKGYEHKIINTFQFRESLLNQDDLDILQRIANCESVAVHIRKGDYEGHYKFDLCNKDYYLSAIKYIENFLEGKELYYFIFTEEPLNMFRGKRNYIEISHLENCGIDLFMMSKCKHNIIANSTFSYWAAVLNRNEDKVVIAPKYAYREKAILRKLPIPSQWRAVDNDCR